MHALSYVYIKFLLINLCHRLLPLAKKKWSYWTKPTTNDAEHNFKLYKTKLLTRTPLTPVFPEQDELALITPQNQSWNYLFWLCSEWRFNLCRYGINTRARYFLICCDDKYLGFFNKQYLIRVNRDYYNANISIWMHAFVCLVLIMVNVVHELIISLPIRQIEIMKCEHQ